jgi:hypothetical protein
MRWLVEVASLGKTDLQKICVEAESWQRALQAARAHRGEEGPMSGFSIELLEEGYRAVDPVARVRFVVKRAPEDMPVTATPKGTSKGSVAPSPPSSAEPTAPKMPFAPASSSPAAGSKIPRPVSAKPPAEATPASPDGTGAQTPEAKKKAETMTFATKGESAPSAKSDPVAERPETPEVGSPMPGLPPVKLLTRREQEPADNSPLTYREYAFAVPEGTSEDAAAEVLRAQLRLVEAHIAGAKLGKLVNLAVFDVEFSSGAPPRRPLATLTWKDWKGEAVVAFPGRGAPSTLPRPPSKQPPSLVPPAGDVVAPAPPVPIIVPPTASAPPPAAIAQGAAPASPVTEPLVGKGTSAPPPAAASVAPAPAPAPIAPAAPPEPVMREAKPRSPSEPPASGMVRTPSGRFIRGRVTGDELITSLFEAMHDLHFLRDALDGGQFCLALATEVLPARAALIHFFDVERREWVVACTRGKDTLRLLNTRTSESESLFREAAKKRRAVVVADASELSSERYQPLGGGKSLICAPIMQAGRALGAMEIVNPLDGKPFSEDEGNAMTYIAEQYAEYLGSRGIVLDRDRIQSAAAAR